MSTVATVWAGVPESARYVILEHRTGGWNGREDHWDVMLEQSDGLLTWASPPFLSGPSQWSVQLLAPHRSVYLDYEGPISENRGCVRRLDRGHFAVVGRHSDRISLEWVGPVFAGRWDWVVADGQWSMVRWS